MYFTVVVLGYCGRYEIFCSVLVACVDGRLCVLEALRALNHDRNVMNRAKHFDTAAVIGWPPGPALVTMKLACLSSSYSTSMVCTDASKQMYGAVVYLHNLKTNTNHLILSRSKLVNSKISSWPIACI